MLKYSACSHVKKYIYTCKQVSILKRQLSDLLFWLFQKPTIDYSNMRFQMSGKMIMCIHLTQEGPGWHAKDHDQSPISDQLGRMGQDKWGRTCRMCPNEHQPSVGIVIVIFRDFLVGSIKNNIYPDFYLNVPVIRLQRLSETFSRILDSPEAYEQQEVTCI